MASFWDTLPAKLADTWPARLGNDIYSAMKAPGNAYASTPDNPVTTEQMIKPAADLGGMIMGGSYAAAPAMKNASGMGIRAYHGSPHDFDKFDLAKIGTGEGAQAYGHGLYFAEREGTARQYRDVLSDGKARAIDGNPELTLPSWVAKKVESGNPQAFADVRSDFQGRIVEMRRQLADPNTMQPWNIEANIPGLENILKALDQVEKGAALKPAGRMYEVNINAKPEQFLDWDKPLAQQPQVMRRLNAAGNDDAWTRDFLRMDLKDDPKITGDLFHDKLKYRFSGDQSATNPYLREGGIPGIKYLDQRSRAAGDGSRNYVVFDPNIIEIMKKYGIALPGAAGATQMLGANQSAPMTGL